ncbi:AsmA family protein [Sphingomonas sp. MMS24-J13]|uniref:AsmA family protein n=1 Tax=Sphingomonas sp. MMS24-J13 TaxID=3238686 RepID=UPI00384DAA93
MIVASLLLLLLVLLLTTLALIDRGYLDGPIARTASFKLGRTIRFRTLRTHLLAREPDVRIEGLTIGNPAWLPQGNLAEVGAFTVHLRFWPMLLGRADVTALTIDRPMLRLVRFGPRRNNWSMGHGGDGPAFAPLRGVGIVSITNGRIAFHDYARQLIVEGSFAQATTGQLPFTMAGSGMLKGGPIRFRAAGGQIHGKVVGQPYPFVLDLIDGKTILRAEGTSGDAFDLRTYALAVSAHGPNLADIGYLFNLITPNSAPYTLTTRAFSDGAHLRFDALDAHMGASHIKGRIWSNHSTARRQLQAEFDAPVLARQDIDAMLSSVPPRNVASMQSGAVRPGLPSKYILSDVPISLRRLRGADFDFKVHIGTLTGYALPLTDIFTRIDLDHGLLDFPFFNARLYSGKVAGSGRFDGTRARPVLGARLDLVGARLAEIGQPVSPPPGRLDMRIQLTGTGNSLHEAASTATGSLALNVTGAVVPKKAAWILGGDLLRAALGGSGKDLPLSCAKADFKGKDGVLQVQRLALGTSLGTASGTGSIDLGTEQIALVVQGQPAKRRLFQVAAPVKIAGPWLKPVITVLPGHDARKLGLKGKAGLLLTPLAGLLPLGKDKAPPVATCS